MEERQLGKRGPQVPVICFGAWPIGGGMGHVDEDVAIATVQHAVDQGVTFIDTAEAYRSSQELVGRALQGRRDRVFLATKVSRGDLSPRHIAEAIDESLRALGTDHIDLYQAHSWDANHPIDETMRAFEALVQSGKVRFVGVSNFDVPQMEQTLRCRWFDSLQPRYSILFPQAGEAILPFCREQGIGVIVHSPLAKGLLSGKYTAASRFPNDDERSSHPTFQGDSFLRNLDVVGRLAQYAGQRGHTVLELAIAWTLANPAVTSCIVGARAPAQVDDHVRAADWRLTPRDMEDIDRLLAR
jgi:aryl-alcohol dehydrogenase-like predicted oxidoreductase